MAAFFRCSRHPRKFESCSDRSFALSRRLLLRGVLIVCRGSGVWLDWCGRSWDANAVQKLLRVDGGGNEVRRSAATDECKEVWDEAVIGDLGVPSRTIPSRFVIRITCCQSIGAFEIQVPTVAPHFDATYEKDVRNGSVNCVCLVVHRRFRIGPARHWLEPVLTLDPRTAAPYVGARRCR